MQSPWQTILQDAVSLRHTLHRSPELSWQEQQTAQRVRQSLDQLNIPWRVCAEHGTVGILAPNAKGEHIALRGDMDALPIHELTDVDYRSEVEGCMHACGHDGHTAALWATAAWLKQQEDRLPGPVSLIFQPAEEGGHGAREMIADGALDGVDYIFGWHNWPAIPLGQAACPDGPVMSGNGTFKIEVTGQGGHASQPELCRDPVLAAAAITLNLQQIVSRRLPPQAAAVVSVSSIRADAAPTVTPELATMTGSIRLSDPSLRETLNTLIQQISEDTARTYGVTATVSSEPRYEATINHGGAASRFRQALSEELGEDWCMESLPQPIMASEDFSYYLQQIPGAFALMGMGGESKYQFPCHSPHYQFNDALLAPVVAVFSRLVGAEIPESHS
ncbi:N(2)-acetyl-L-2,4-diaminobutanoate deacetylase DoeB2 [Pseudomaricurvus sp.]|uniref:N(2)-acetyl-L-2,4-diaminobutanoate deacetylase DoeB2 n=1 Tax=Pseudomaricurvus sp. TaxID=2004510 RepID=UPI003F6B6847